MNNSELQEGGLWNLILSFWPLKEQRDLEKQNQLELNGHTKLVKLNEIETKLKNSFYVTIDMNMPVYKEFLLDSYMDDVPILLFFTGMGKTIKIIHKLFENLIFCKDARIYHEIYTLNQMNIFCLNECVQEAIELYEYVRKKYPYRPILLVGHSLGSGIVAQILKYLSHKKRDPFLMGALLLNTAPNITFAVKPLFLLRGII